MESTPLSTATSTLFNLTKTLTAPSKSSTSNLSRSRLHRTLQHRLISTRIKCLQNGDFKKQFEFAASYSSVPAISTRNLFLTAPISSRLACISSSAASFASGGGSDGASGGNSGGGGGGDGGSSGGEIDTKSVAAGTEDVSALSPDVIILDVGGMTCGGCAASVKRILESQPNVSSANVNLATETAIVWPVPEAKAIQNWQQQLGETLAKHLTNCGFQSNLRGQGAIQGDIA